MTIDHDASYWAEDAKVEFAVAVEHRMQRLGMSRTELAEQLQTSKANVTKLLRGDTNLTIESMSRIAYALGGKVQMHIVAQQNRSRWVEIIESTTKQPAIPSSLWGTKPNSGTKHAIYA